MNFLLAAFFVAALFAAELPVHAVSNLSPVHCGHGKEPPCQPPPPPPPVPIVSFNPSAPSIPDSTPVGTQISQIVVRMSDGSAFTGSLDFASPYLSDGGICAIQGTNLLLGAALPAGSSTQNCTIIATQ